MKNKTFVIAEAGVNHNGSLDMAKQLIDVAAEAGADAVKFQSFKTEKCISKLAVKAEYQTKTTDKDESQFDMIKKLELDEDAHHVLNKHCKKKGIHFLSTPFDFDSLDLLDRVLNLPCFKIPSGEITNAPLLLKIAQTGKPVILSTGMCTLGEVEEALGVLAFGYIEKINSEPSITEFRKAYSSMAGQEQLRGLVSLLHCTTEYPAPFSDVNLRAMDTLRSAFHLPVGYSDHTYGWVISIAAVARGATIVEKHFTLDSKLQGPDHSSSLEPKQLKEMVDSIRLVEMSLGNGRKIPSKSEIKNLPVARKSIVALSDITKNEKLTNHNIGLKRPGTGISPIRYWEYLDSLASRDFHEDELLE